MLAPAAVEADPELPRRLAQLYMMLMDGLFMQIRTSTPKETKRLVSIVSAGLSRHLETMGMTA